MLYLFEKRELPNLFGKKMTEHAGSNQGVYIYGETRLYISDDVYASARILSHLKPRVLADTLGLP
jgi:hypothetical protein